VKANGRPDLYLYKTPLGEQMKYPTKRESLDQSSTFLNTGYRIDYLEYPETPKYIGVLKLKDSIENITKSMIEKFAEEYTKTNGIISSHLQ
jgi:hypothetical protein